jgi:hypothetical protein
LLKGLLESLFVKLLHLWHLLPLSLLRDPEKQMLVLSLPQPQLEGFLTMALGETVKMAEGLGQQALVPSPSAFLLEMQMAPGEESF